MNYPYYSPNFYIGDLFYAARMNRDDATERVKDHFREVTGKKYVIVTNSCRSALYLAWKVIEQKGEVITSPLTCKVAIDPIVETGNTPVYADVRLSDLTINPHDIEHRINDKTIAVQAIHLGGYSCEMNNLKELAKKNNLVLIEDCAQGYGAEIDGMHTGSFGDIACFSLIKNAYGFGGGIFATDDLVYYEKAKRYASEFKKSSKLLSVYRIIRNVLETKHSSSVSKTLLKGLLNLKGDSKSYKSVEKQLSQPDSLMAKIFSRQLNNIKSLHEKRNELGNFMVRLLQEDHLIVNSGNENQRSSYTKFYLYNKDIDYGNLSIKCRDNGIEVMHLEQRKDSPKQKRLVPEEESLRNGLKNYNQVHDSLISLPLFETMTEKDIQIIVKFFSED